MDKDFDGSGEAPSQQDDRQTDAVTQWRQQMQVEVQAYFDNLRMQGVAEVQRHPLRGRTFIDVTIEGRRFKGRVRKGPQIMVDEDECLLTCASISYGADFLSPNGPTQWAISKYRTQQRIALDDLTQQGLRALACEFGLLIHGAGYEASEALLAPDCFLHSPAWAGLRNWCLTNPLVARRQLREQADLLRRVSLPQTRPKRGSRYRNIYEFAYLMGS
jgi:hypothetical protein